jgi:ATP-dependent RNA helicase DDX47/RRP3
MELFPAERDEVLLLLERVSEAQRLATMAMKEADAGKKGKRKGEDGDEGGSGGPGGGGRGGGRPAKRGGKKY